MSAMLVLTSLGNRQQARELARELVSRRLAACVNLIPGVESCYRWQGEIHTDEELLLLIKTHPDRFDALTEAIRELHPYDLPEILSFRASGGEPAFLSWIADSVRESGT